MTKSSWLAFAGLLATTVSAAGAQQASVGTLVVQLTGFASEKGEVLIQLADSREDYESDDEGFRTGRVRAVAGSAGHRFEALPWGDYALKVFHDENSNLELDIGWMGPQERYGFSNGARGLLGPPDWDEARFTFDRPEQTVEIEVK